ncbi:glycosyltransferase [Enterococcus faecium]|uniref:glycosyltransferase n=1 Tax=Enterococcus faecium TaxID=1352 RepID=UPI000CF2E546|nr:glycosyltransferase [Enterococcus faecium]EME3535090.1 glycosyltransferase [Enterococcus faecium]PQF45428.1 dTDP-rhamnosyl transferase rfbG [Enterococcus faecium]
MRDSSYTVSVIMPIYNGEKNIIEQLESIRNQERMPDEVLLCDDGSTDSTVEIVRNFIEKHQLTGWQLLINEENIGWRKNFIRLIHQATGDVIFFSDQDDIWYAHKIKHMSEKIMSDPENIKVLVSNYDELIEENGVSYPCEKRKIPTKQPNDYIYFSKKNVFLNRPGWVYAFQKDFIPTFDKFLETSLYPVHDIAMWSSGVLTDKLYLLNEKTGLWRKHGSSAMQIENEETEKTAETKKNIRLGKLELLKILTISNLNFVQRTDVPDKDYKEKTLKALLKELETRLKIIEEDKLLNILKNFKSYAVLHSFLADILYFVKSRLNKKYR